VTIDFAVGTGLEAVQAAAYALLVNNLNDAIGEMEARGQAFDDDLSARVGFDVTRGVPTTLERIEEPQAFVYGHRPSLIDAPVDLYPNASVMAFASTGSAEQLDQLDGRRDVLQVEVMVKALDKHEDGTAEELCNRRIHRTADAVIMVFAGDRTLGGAVAEISEEPSVEHGNVFVRKRDTRMGARFLWQGTHIEWAVERFGHRS